MIGCGGKGANACVMAAKLGAKTSMIGRVSTTYSMLHSILVVTSKKLNVYL